MPLMTIGTEKGKLLALLPCGRFFLILYLGYGARCQFLSSVPWGERQTRCFHLHPPIPSNVFLFLETTINLPVITDIFPC